MLDLRFRTVERWPRERCKHRRSGGFKCAMSTCYDDLERELAALGGRDIIVQTFHDTKDIRNDGWPRSNAANPKDPGVILSCVTKYGPKSWACDTFCTWTENLRAICLTLMKLAHIDAYGTTVGGEQYTGFAALPSGGPKCADDAWSFIADAAGVVRGEGLPSKETLRRAYRLAAQRLHPDAGGTNEAFSKLTAANTMLEGART